MELLPTVDALKWIAQEQASRSLSEEKVPMPQLFLKRERLVFSYEPLWVIGVISPWNYPWSIPVRRGRAGADGGQRRGAEAGLADAADRRADRLGVLSFFCAGGAAAGGARTGHGSRRWPSRVSSKVFFTGSVQTGRQRRRRPAPGSLKGCVLKLGGKDPISCFGDAHLEHAIAGADVGRIRQRGADLLGDRARVRGALGRGPVHRRRRGARGCGSGCGWAIR